MNNRTSFQLDWQGDDVTVWAHRLTNGGRITVCHRMTGFGYMDEETGYSSPCGQFWLASGGYDITTALHLLDSEEAMIKWVIERANTCTGGHPEWKKVGTPLAYLVARENWKPTGATP
jgi:hypothetical protein